MEHHYIMENEKILLSPMGPEESEQYRLLRNREDNAHFFFTDAEITREAQSAWFNRYLSDSAQLMFSIYEKPEGRWVGGIGVYDIDRGRKCAEVGRIIVDRQLAGGRHYGSEAIRLLGRLSKERLGLERLYAHIYSSNIASIRSFLNAGYHQTEVTDEMVRVECSFL